MNTLPLRQVYEVESAKNVGNFCLIAFLKKLGITHYFGVNGGGVIHVAKYLGPFTNLQQAQDGIPRLFTIPEYAAGFAPLGYYLATKKIACSLATTGAAIKLAGCGMSDAKLHNIPAVYLIALNSTHSIGHAPLQDVSEHGMSVIEQMRAELGDGCIVIDDIQQLEYKLLQVHHILQQSRPVALAFHPDILSQEKRPLKIFPLNKKTLLRPQDVDVFISQFSLLAKRRRVILYVGEEAAFYPGIQKLVSEFAELLQAPTIWSINGANAVDPDSPLCYGYVLFGGNDRAIDLLQSINNEDLVITLGFCAGEYSLNLQKLNAKYVWHIGAYEKGYGQTDDSYQHRCTGKYTRIHADIALFLQKANQRLRELNIQDSRPKAACYKDLNFRQIQREVKPGCVDMVAFYEQLSKLWRKNSIGFDDVCTAYKDRQYVTQRPHPNIKFWALHHGSAMGGAFGAGVGAKIANPDLHTFIFSGDGCWRLFAGCLADVAHLGLRLFIINNQSYAIVHQGLGVILPQTEKERYHTQIAAIDFVSCAKAMGWAGVHLNADLSNLEEIMTACYANPHQSMLIEVPVDPDQVIGLNPRVINL